MGFIEFPANFSGHLRDRILEKNYIGNGTLLGSKINIRMDESSEYFFITKCIEEECVNEADFCITNYACRCSYTRLGPCDDYEKVSSISGKIGH